MERLRTAALVIIVAAAMIAAWLWSNAGLYPHAETQPPASTPASAAQFDRSISDGAITVAFPSADFGLAAKPTQVLVRSYIPPCGEPFDYCIYYIGGAYAGTNFESAGIRIAKRADLSTVHSCLGSQPDGYANLAPLTASSSDYSAATFANVGSAAAGHYAAGALYRLAYDGACYEFETRIGQSQFMNYPSGTIQKFTDADEAALRAELLRILGTVTLPSGTHVLFPQPR